MKKFLLTIFITIILLNKYEAQTTTNQLIQQGIFKAYNMEINSAEKIFNRVIKRAPNLPHGYFHLAQIHFWCFLGSREEYHFHEFNKYAELAQNKIDSLLDINQNNFRITYMAGNLASWRAMINATNNSSVDALWYSKKAIDYYEKALKINPKFYDAYFGLGLFNYAMSFVPDFLKWAVDLTGLSSDKYKGFNYIKTAYRKGILDKTEIEFHLAKIYSDYFAAYDSSYNLLRKLISNYPNNSLFRYQYAVTLIRDKKLDNALKILNDVIKLDNKYFPQVTSLANYRKGEIYFKKNQFGKAIQHYQIFLKTTREPDLKGSAALNIALSYKMLNDDDEYKKYLHKANEGNADLFEDAYAKEKSEYFMDSGISSVDLFLIRMKNYIDAGWYKIAYDSIKSKIESINHGRKNLALIYLSEASLYLGNLQDAVKYAKDVLELEDKREKWTVPFANFIIAKCNYFLNDKENAKKYLAAAEESNDYEFRDYIQSLIENLKRKLHRIKH